MPKPLPLVDAGSQPQSVFDAMAGLVRTACDSPIALLVLVDGQGQWVVKATAGLDEAGRRLGPIETWCTEAWPEKQALEVPDLHLDARFQGDPWATALPDVRFCAAVPLPGPDGECRGVLLAMDRAPKKLDPTQWLMLQALAQMACQTLKLCAGPDGAPVSEEPHHQQTRQSLSQRLADSERFIRQITDSLPIRIAYIDKDRRYRFVNQANCDCFNRDRSEIIGRTRSELTQGAVDAVLEPRILAALAGQAQSFEFEETVNGRLRRFEAHVVPDLSASGEVQGFFSTTIDITERSAAARAMRELTAIFDNTTDYVVQTDARGNTVYMNPAILKALSMQPHAPGALPHFTEFITLQTQQQFTEEILPALNSRDVWLGQTAVRSGARGEVPVSHMVIAHRDAQNRVDRYSSVMRDISRQVEAQQALLRQTATLQAVTEAIPAIVAVVGHDEKCRFITSRFAHWIGKPRAQIIDQPLHQVLKPDEYLHQQPWIRRALAGETVHFERDYPGRSKGRNFAVSFIPLAVDGSASNGFLAVSRDITDYKQEELRLLNLAHRDPLTGLLNRSGLEEFLERRMQDSDGSSLAILYIDLDHFKPVNDTHGHPVGDQVLQLFAQRLRGVVRPTDAVARLGGDEFVVLLTEIYDPASAGAVADKIAAAAGTPFQVAQLQIRIGASLGVAHGVEASGDWRELIARADAMLYRAKEGGRGRHAIEAPRGGTGKRGKPG